MTSQAKPTFEEYLNAMSHDTFNNVVLDIARLPCNWERIERRCGVELLEEFNNDAIDKIRREYDARYAGAETE